MGNRSFLGSDHSLCFGPPDRGHPRQAMATVRRGEDDEMTAWIFSWLVVAMFLGAGLFLRVYADVMMEQDEEDEPWQMQS